VSRLRHTGVAAILAGALVFAGQGGELTFGSPSDLVDGVFVALWAGGVVPVALAGGIVAAAVDIDPAGRFPSIHDIGLFVFEGARIALGVVLLLRADPSTHRTDPH
jgi:hypothetical protein